MTTSATPPTSSTPTSRPASSGPQPTGTGKTRIFVTLPANPILGLPVRSFWTTGHIAIKFIETHCVLTNGKWLGQPFKLQRWQQEWLLELFTVVEREPGIWHRRYRWSLLGVPKKNGKSELAAALGLYFLLGDGEPAAYIPICASTEEQANMVFGAATTMVNQSPTLAKFVTPFAGAITVPSATGSTLVRVAAVAGGNDGKNNFVVIIDELHEFTGPQQVGCWNILTNGTGAREEPMVLQITTAGYDLNTICGEQYTYGKAVLKGEVADATFLFRWYEAPEGCELDSPAVWEYANPSYGVTVKEAFYKDQLPPRKQPNVFRRYFLNQWTESAEMWLDPGVWEKLRSDLQLVARADTKDAPITWVGVDAATRHDSCAIVWGQWRPSGAVNAKGEALHRLVLRCRIWSAPLDPRTKKPRAGWVLPIEEVKDHIRFLHATYNVQQAAYDPAFITWVAIELLGEGVPMLEFSQNATRMVPASQALYERAKQAHIAHDGDELFAAQIKAAAAVLVGGGDGGWRLTKGKARRHMDAAIAAAMVAYLAGVPPELLPRTSFRLFGDDGEDTDDDE